MTTTILTDIIVGSQKLVDTLCFKVYNNRMQDKLIRLTEMIPGDRGTIDCVDIKDKDYHNRISCMGLKCNQTICVIRKLFGAYHCGIGNGTCEMAIRERDAEQIYVYREKA